MKRILTLTLAMLMLVSLLAGCSNGETSSTSAAQTTVATTEAATSAASASEAATTAPTSSAASGSTWDTGSITVEPLGIDLGGVAVSYMCDMGMNEARSVVWENISKYASETYNGEVTFGLDDSSNFKSKIQTLSAAGMAPDVFNSANSAGFPDLVKAEALLALDDYIATCMPRAYAKVEEYMFDAVTFDGKIYAMIPFKDLVERNCVIYYKTPFDEAGIELTPFVRFSENYDEFYAMREWRDANDKDGYDMPISEAYPTWFREAVLEYVGSSSTGVGCNFKGVETVAGYEACTQLFNMYDCPEFLAHVKTLNQLVTDRINPYDKSNWDSDKVLRNSGKVYCYNSQGTMFPPDTLQYDNAALNVQAINLSYTGYTCGALQVVSSNTENPEAACKLIEILSCDKYIGTSLRLGAEGQHWVMDENGQADTSLGLESKIKYWFGVQLGDITNCVIPDNYAANFKDLVKELNSEAVVSDNLGFTADSTDVQTEVTAIGSVTAEYLSGTTLYSGMLTDEETEKMYNEFIEKMKASGVDKVIAEYQSQLDAWRAAR